MKHEILALIPRSSDVPSEPDFLPVEAGDFTALFVPGSRSFGCGDALRRGRLAAASKRQAWLERLMPIGPVLAFAPGSVLEPGAAEALVGANAGMLASLSDRLKGCVQYQVTVDWAEGRVLERFRAAPEIAPLFASSSVSGPAIAGAVARLAGRLARSITMQLETVSREIAELPRASGILSNSVLLVDQRDERALDDVLAAIDTIWSEGFRIRQIGPGPATSFATLRLRRCGKRDVSQAFRTLGLPFPSTTDAVRERRQELLRRSGSDVEAVRAAARLANAACGPKGLDEHVYLIDVWSEGQAALPLMEDVA